MKFKAFALLALAVGVVLMAVGAAAPIIALKNDGEAIGIIGGADKPTCGYMAFHALSGWPVSLILLGEALSLSTLFCVLFSPTAKKHCRIQTTVVALGLSAVGAAGLICFLTWAFLVGFGAMARHPIAYPWSICLGMVCALGFAGLGALYIRLRRDCRSLLGMLIDILTGILYLPGFFFALSCLAEICR